MTKNTYNPYEIMMDKYDKEEMLSDVREAMLYQLGVDVSCEELNHFFTGKGKAALSGCAEWQQCFAVEKMLEFYYMHARDETLAKQIETMTMLTSRGNEHQAKNQFIRARVAGWEKDCIRRKADAAHMTESEFVRRAAMDREVTVIEGMDELLRELRYQGNNLNQLTVMARQGRITQVNYEPFTEVYRNAWQTLNSLLSHAV